MATKLSERSNATLADVTTTGRMVTPADLASAGVCRSYTSLQEWTRKGWLPEPHTLPNGRIYWLGEEIAAALSERSGRGHRRARANAASDPGIAA